LDELAALITALPEDKKFINKISKIIKDRHNIYFDEQKVDWGMAEHLAFATLLSEGYDVRLSGEDVGRGTFSHRHAVVKAEETEEEIIPLSRITAQGGGKLHVYNSLLSEYGDVLYISTDKINIDTIYLEDRKDNLYAHPEEYFEILAQGRFKRKI